VVEITEKNFHHEFLAFAKRDDATKTEPSKSYVMIRPDRETDHAKHRYRDQDERRNGNAAKEAWFEYLAAKGFLKILSAWRGMLKSGYSVMVVCDDPKAFDLLFVPRREWSD
jgi:hypothetical protein